MQRQKFPHPEKQSGLYKLSFMLATWFYSGRAPKAPGTCGTIAALPFCLAIQILFGNTALALFAVVTFIIGIAVSDYVMNRLKQHDPGYIVIDEVAGQAITILAIPPSLSAFPLFLAYLAAFALFRAFDILKPWPINLADKRLKKGFGVMFDDTLAGIAGFIVLKIILIYAL